MITSVVYFFPSWGGSIIAYILKFLFYIFLMYIAYALIDESINFITRNWDRAKLSYIDEREHVKGNTLANLSRIDLLGATFRLFHYIKYNKRRALQEIWFNYLSNVAIYLTSIGIIFIIILFFVYNFLIK